MPVQTVFPGDSIWVIPSSYEWTVVTDGEGAKLGYVPTAKLTTTPPTAEQILQAKVAHARSDSLAAIERRKREQAAVVQAASDTKARRKERIARIQGILIGDCTPPRKWVEKRIEKNPLWPDQVIATTTCNRVQLGMTQEQAIAGWGRPRDINRSTYSFGIHEQWVYGRYGERGYLYFEDGILTSIQN